MVKKITLSPEQNMAANPSNNVWVQANAGTGKTSVLVQRLLRILFRSDNIENCGILCLTYTKAAAGEMRNRILRELQKWAMATDDELSDMLVGISVSAKITETDIAHARKIFFTYIDNPDLLKIKTIHSFCEEILRQFPLEAGISPAWSLISDDVQRTLLVDTFNKLINTSNSETVAGAFAHIVERIDASKLSELLNILVMHYKDFIQTENNFNYRKYFIDTIRKFLNLDTPVQTQYSVDELQKIIKLATMDKNSSKKPVQYLTDIINITKQYINNTINFDEYKKIYLTANGTPRKNISAKAYLVAEQMRVYAVDQYNMSEQIFTDTMSVFDLSAAFAQMYDQTKRQFNLLDFEDLILYTKKLFSSPDVMGWVLSQLNVRLTHILVDEAQDTSPLQWDILRLLAGDFFTDGNTAQNPHSMFVVGDTKQSIYGFQGADPRAFDDSRTEIKKQIQQNMRTLNEVPLVQSFRSMPPILYAVDTFFNDQEIKEETGFVNNSHKWVKSAKSSFVEIHKIIDAKDADVDNDAFVAGIATQIKTVLSEGIFTPSDIMVLVQNRDPMAPLLVKELKRLNIPVAGSDRIVLPRFPAIRDLLNLVRFCINPNDDFSLCCVLKSPLFRLKDADIFNICHARNEWNKAARSASADTAPITVFTVLEKQNPTVYTRVSDILKHSQQLGPYSFFSYVLNDNNSRQSMIAALGAQIIDPLEEFMTICLSYERTQSGTLREFLKWFITGGSVIKRDMDNAPGVRIATIHGSKGLEAPVVFLIDTVRTPKPERIFPINHDLKNTNYTNMPPPWIWVPRKVNSEIYTYAEQQLNKTRISEYYRLLYVAMTRAINRLYVYGFASKGTPAQDLSWHTQLWRVLSNDAHATISDEFVRIENVE